MKKIFMMLVLVALTILTGCATTSYETKVAESQAVIEKSFAQIGYNISDVIANSADRKSHRDLEWIQKRVVFLDKGNLEWSEINKIFKYNKNYPYKMQLRVSESESSAEIRRSFEFKMDKVNCIYRVDFVKPRRRR